MSTAQETLKKSLARQAANGCGGGCSVLSVDILINRAEVWSGSN
jgi:hypothetical protein